jgi:hypothetical protein
MMDKSQTPTSYAQPSVRGHNRVAGNRRAWRNGRVSDLPPEIPTVTIRNCVITYSPVTYRQR